MASMLVWPNDLVDIMVKPFITCLCSNYDARVVLDGKSLVIEQVYGN